MNKFAKMLVATCMCLCMALVAAGCGSSSQPSSSSPSSEKMTTVVSDKVVSSSSSSSKSAVGDKPVYVLLAGMDTRFGTADGAGTTENDPAYADTLLLVRVDPKDHRVGVLSIPRDTGATFEGSDSSDIDGKINGASVLYGVAGENGTVDQVEALTGVTVDYYFATTFSKFASLIDEIGGVTVDVPVTIGLPDIIADGEEGPNTYVQAGEGQHLDGKEALIFSRMRKDYAYEGEAVRQMNARQVICSAISFVASQPVEDAAKYASIMVNQCETNMSEDELKAYIEAFQGKDIAFQTGTGPYVGSISAAGPWLIPREEETYAALIGAMENNGDMQAIVANPPVSLK